MKLYCENSAGAVTLLASATGATGTVSSVAVSGGTTGLTTSGGPITTTGTITLAGTLAVANGGTGVTTSTGTTNVVLSNSPTLVSPALGTPASGVVTNLTGTASININGTVGATTPAAGAFTTVSATGVATFAAGTVALPSITTAGDTNTGVYYPSADIAGITTGGIERGRFLSTGFSVTGTSSASGELASFGSSGGAANRLKATYNSGSGLALVGPDSNGGTTSLDIGVSNAGTYGTILAVRTTGLAVTGAVSASTVLQMPDGVVGTPGLRVGTSSTTGLFSSADNSLRVSCSGAQIASFTGTGLAVTGALSATGVSTFAAGTAALPSITTSGDTNTGIYFPAADTIAFTEGGAEAMRIDSSGNVGIGTASPDAKLTIKQTANSTLNGLKVIRSDTSAHSVMYMGGDDGLYIQNQAVGATIFYTNSTERMRINSSGNVLIGRTSGNADARFTPDGGSTDSSPCIDFLKGSATTTTAQVYARFFCNNNTTATGSITANGVSAATFTAYSDRRLKENITDLPSQLANIMALRPVEFDYIGYENGEGHQLGFIAQEVQEIYPDLVGEGADGMLTLSDMNKNDARLIKCIQEQQALILALTDRIAALETK
jgi:hypothetical protein